MREIQIRQALNGYVVQVGCQTVVFESKEALLAHLSLYLANPRQYEQEFIKKYAMSEDTMPRDQELAARRAETAPHQYAIQSGALGVGTNRI